MEGRGAVEIVGSFSRRDARLAVLFSDDHGDGGNRDNADAGGRDAHEHEDGCAVPPADRRADGRAYGARRADADVRER